MKSTSPVSNEHSISKLEEAFGIFNKISADLGSSYQNLESKVVSLKEELARSNSARIMELTEKEKLAAKLSTLMDALPGGVVVIDAADSVVQANPAANQIIGEEFIGRKWNSVVSQIASCMPLSDGEYSLHDNKRVSITSSPFGGDGDRIILITDITENYRLNNILNREKRLAALGEMAARLAHQVRTPLSSAILYLSNLSTQINNQQKDASSITIKNVKTQLSQIEKLVEGMLAYIKGDISANQTFSPVALLQEVKQATDLQIAAADGFVDIIHHCDDFQVRGDKEALFNALTNLVVNAIQATESMPHISLDLIREPDCTQFVIADNGPGIHEGIKDQIFDPFYSTRVGGTGLGLAVVMSAAKSHRGEISVENSPQGGAVFTLTIPEKACGHIGWMSDAVSGA